MKHVVYLAGKVPKGTGEKKAFVNWRSEFRVTVRVCSREFGFEDTVEFLDPAHSVNYGCIPTEAYFGRDVHMIHSSDVIIVDARAKIGLGTAQEILIAKYYNIPSIAVCPKDSHYNKHIDAGNGELFHYLHPFLYATADIVVETFDDAARVLVEHLSGKNRIRMKPMNCIESSRKEYEEKFLAQDDYLKEYTSKQSRSACVRIADGKVDKRQTCTVTEFPTSLSGLGIAHVTFNGRYPEHGRARNTHCSMAYAVISGLLTVQTTSGTVDVREGDVYYFAPHEWYVVSGNASVILASSPAWYPEQYEMSD